MEWLPRVQAARTSNGDLLLLIDFADGEGSLMRDHRAAAVVESADSTFVPLDRGLAHEAVTVFQEHAGRSNLWVGKPKGTTPVWHVILAAAPGLSTKADQRRKDMGKILLSSPCLLWPLR